MTTLAQNGPFAAVIGWLARAEVWLDDKGKGAWIAAMVIGFIAFWPIGLALLAYMIWNEKMTCSRSRKKAYKENGTYFQDTGNAAFDSYRMSTLRRLEEEQQNFAAFLKRLRDARDKAEFDHFMEERAKSASLQES